VNKYEELAVALVHIILDPKNIVAADMLNCTSWVCAGLSDKERSEILAWVITEARKLTQ